MTASTAQTGAIASCRFPSPRTARGRRLAAAPALTSSPRSWQHRYSLVTSRNLDPAPLSRSGDRPARSLHSRQPGHRSPGRAARAKPYPVHMTLVPPFAVGQRFAGIAGPDGGTPDVSEDEPLDAVTAGRLGGAEDTRHGRPRRRRIGWAVAIPRRRRTSGRHPPPSSGTPGTPGPRPRWIRRS